MYITMATVKGQVLIPVHLRKKYHIHKGSKLAIFDRKGEIVLKPLEEEPVKYGLGLLANKPSALKELVRDRKRESGL